MSSSELPKTDEVSIERITRRLISASLFLRLICPAILNPSLFNLHSGLPSEKASRILTLVAKMVLNLANNQVFTEKERYMEPMSEFITGNSLGMEEFFGDISGAGYAGSEGWAKIVKKNKSKKGWKGEPLGNGFFL